MKSFAFRLPLFAYSTALSVVLLALQSNVRGQSDDFNDGNDDGWTHLDLSAAGLPASIYSFPDDGSGGKAYRIFSPVPPVTNAGPARAVTYRADVNYTNFTMAVDLVSWDATLHQTFGCLIRGAHLGLGQTTGYILNYVHLRPGAPGGDFQINRITGESPTTIAHALVTLDPSRKYRLIATGFGNYLSGKIYDLSNLTIPVATTEVVDGTYPNGFMGLFNYSLITGAQETAPTSTADVTFDNYSVTGSALPGPTQRGMVDLTFDPGSATDGPVDAIAEQSDGKIIIGGEFRIADRRRDTRRDGALGSIAVAGRVADLG